VRGNFFYAVYRLIYSNENNEKGGFHSGKKRSEDLKVGRLEGRRLEGWRGGRMDEVLKVMGCSDGG
jgi:hypothetical protein